MGWYVCFTALLDVNGDESKLSKERFKQCDRTNPNTPPEAWNLARKKYQEHWDKFCEKFAKGPFGGYYDYDRDKFFKLRNCQWEIHKESL